MEVCLQRRNRVKTSIYFIIGVRPDIAFFVIALFTVSLFFCILIAKKHQLFYFNQLQNRNQRKKLEADMERAEDNEKA